MIFEQKLGEWLAQEINARLQLVDKRLTCKRYDEESFKPLHANTEEVAMLVSGGNATRARVAGLDQNVLPLAVTIVCKAEYSTTVRNAIEAVQRTYNAKPFTLTYYDAVKAGNLTTYVKAIFTTPFSIDKSDYRTKNATIKATFASFSATVSYGETAVIDPVPVKLTLKQGTSEETFVIEHIADYNFAAIPAYETFLAQGEERAGQCQLSRTNSFSYTVYKTAGDPLQEIFERELHGLADGLAGKKLFLTFDEEAPLEISTYQLVESYKDNAAAYVLTLGV